MEKQILVWDIPTRIFHWGLVVSIGYAWFAVEILGDMEQHFYAGYSVLSLLLFRLVWGFVGSDYARFNNFLYSPLQVIDYAKTLLSKTAKPYLGHNPLGGISVFAMLAVLIFQTSSGLFSSDDYYFGPLAGLIDESLVARLTNLHHLNFDIITALIVLHILMIGFYRLRKNERLTKAMFDGKKLLDKKLYAQKRHDKQFYDKKSKVKKAVNNKPAHAELAITGSKLMLAAFILVLCIAAVYLLANSFTDTLPTVEDYYSY